MFEDLIVVLGQAESATLDSFKDGPVRFEVLDGCSEGVRINCQVMDTTDRSDYP